MWIYLCPENDILIKIKFILGQFLNLFFFFYQFFA